MMKRMYMLGMILLISQMAVSQFSHNFKLEKKHLYEMQNAQDLIERDFLDDLAGTVVPIGFSFEIAPNAIADQLRFTQDGQLEAYNESLQERETMLVLSPLTSTNFVDRGVNTNFSESKVSYTHLGMPGNRVLVIQWLNVGFQKELRFHGTTNNHVTFQVAIHENDNKVEFIYGDSKISDFDTYFLNGGPTIGYSSDKLKSRMFLTGHSGSPVANAEETNMTGFPQGTVAYTFIPNVETPIEDESGTKSVAKLNAKVFPNPCVNIFKVALEGATPRAKVLIRSPYGKVVFEGKMERIMEFDLTGFDSGLYLIQLRTANDMIIKKIMKR